MQLCSAVGPQFSPLKKCSFPYTASRVIIFGQVLRSPVGLTHPWKFTSSFNSADSWVIESISFNVCWVSLLKKSTFIPLIPILAHSFNLSRFCSVSRSQLVDQTIIPIPLCFPYSITSSVQSIIPLYVFLPYSSYSNGCQPSSNSTYCQPISADKSIYCL